jgi:hypothetical protein
MMTSGPQIDIQLAQRLLPFNIKAKYPILKPHSSSV